ncbi:PREDICTED: sodium channel protein Nach-like [Dinoponera quadriceps]|uniref:Sodium channel protein Nach-like n=1 Tax=Dinoponera quadriceps TaxID=609295 RepID=A0A6P3Y2Y5_DINQU|nr:PREDICTED: sodium channel protein Nach-like [Dinoponera quadriceps]
MYLYSNCFIDCSIQASLEICGCVPFYYEPVAVKYSLKICDWENFICLYENADNIRVIQEITIRNFTCKCYSPCKDMYYDTQASIGILNRHESNVWYMNKNLTEAQAIVKVFMSYETFTVTDTIPVADELYLLGERSLIRPTLVALRLRARSKRGIPPRFLSSVRGRHIQPLPRLQFHKCRGDLLFHWIVHPVVLQFEEIEVTAGDPGIEGAIDAK